MRALVFLVVPFVVVASTTACGDTTDGSTVVAGGETGGAAGAGSDEIAVFASPLEGIYEITHHQWNLDACEPGGAVVGGHDFFVLLARRVAGVEQVDVLSCSDVDACRVAAEELSTVGVATFYFHYVLDALDGDTLTGSETLQPRAGDQCEAMHFESRLTLPASDTIEVIVEAAHAEPYPAVDGRCDDEAQAAAVEALPCGEYRSLLGVRTNAL